MVGFGGVEIFIGVFILGYVLFGVVIGVVLFLYNDC